MIEVTQKLLPFGTGKPVRWQPWAVLALGVLIVVIGGVLFSPI